MPPGKSSLQHQTLCTIWSANANVRRFYESHESCMGLGPDMQMNAHLSAEHDATYKPFRSLSNLS
jgi:hypothetical protein